MGSIADESEPGASLAPRRVEKARATPSWTHSPPPARLGPIAVWALVSTVTICLTYFATQHPILILGYVAAILLALVAATVRRSARSSRYYAMLVVGLTFLDQSPLAIGGSALRLYQILSLSLFLVVAADYGRRRGPERVIGALPSLLTLSTAAVATSLLWTISPSDTISLAVGQSYLLALFFAIVLLLQQRVVLVADLLTALRWGALLTSAVALLQFVLGLAGSGWGLQEVAGLPWSRPEGLMAEPDWAGLAAAIGLVLATGSHAREKILSWQVLLFSTVVVVTGVRAVWIAVLVAAALSLGLRDSKRLRRVLMAVVGLGALGTLLLFAVEPSLVERLNPLTFLNDSSADQGALNSRLGVLQLIQDRGFDRPILGHGAGSLGYETALEGNRDRYAGGGSSTLGVGPPTSLPRPSGT